MRQSDRKGPDLLSGSPAGDGQRVPGPAPGLTPLIAIVGPTGSGKSELGIAVAHALGGEIVGCDALQVYRGLDAATAKPSRRDRERVRHHLIDVRDPRLDFSLAEYVALAEAAVERIRARGRVPLVVGGTGMYLRGLLRGVVPAPPRDERLRRRLARMADRFGAARLHRFLASLDTVSAERIAPADRQRVLRAIEIALRSPRPWSELLERDGGWGAADRYRALKIGLQVPADEHRGALDRRAEGFFAAGLVAEVRRLLAAGVPASANAFKAIGYRQVLQALDAGDDPALALEAVQRATRRYAKRQRTWFRKEPDLVWFDASRPREELVAEIVSRYRDL